MTWCNKFGIHYLFNDVPILVLFILIPCMIFYEHSCLYLFHCTWFRCIRNCTKNLSHEFLANRWPVYNQFMGIGNLLKVVVYHLLIGRMADLDYRDEFSMVSALICMVTHWTGPMVSHDLRLSSSHDLSKFLYCVVSQPWENIEFVLKLTTTLTYKWDHKPIIYSLWIGSLLMEADSNRYSQ